MKPHPTLQATLPQALENAMLTVEFLRGSLQYASPLENIVLTALLKDATDVMERVGELAAAIRMTYSETGSEG